jgi:hypothetical protein
VGARAKTPVHETYRGFLGGVLGQSQWGFIRVLWALIMLMLHHINEERDDKSFMGVERVS